MLYNNQIYPIQYGLLQTEAPQYQPSYVPDPNRIYNNVYNPFKNDYMTLPENTMQFWNQNKEGFNLLNNVLNLSPSDFPSQGHHSMLSLLALSALRNPSGLTITTKKEEE